MFSPVSQPSTQASDPRDRAALRWIWPAGVRVLLAAFVLLSSVALRLNVSWKGLESSTAYSRAPDLVVDPNTAPASVLEALPHLGPRLVQRLIAEREVRPFESTQDLRRRVRGLGPATLARLEPYLRIEHAGRTVAQHSDPHVEPSMTTTPGPPRLAQASGVPADR